jgi:hypothetical protein
MSMRLKREGDWIQYTTEGGKTFYYNEKTCSFQWEDPFITKSAKSKVIVQPSYSTSSDTHEQEEKKNSTTNERKKPQDNNSSNDSDDVLNFLKTDPNYRHEQTDWKPYTDESTGHVFWYNHVTKVSQWENPFEQQSQQNQQYQGDQSYHADPVDNDLEAFPVYHENDLGL